MIENKQEKKLKLIEFGKRIKAVREYFGLDQEQLALKIGYSQGYVSNLESGKKDITKGILLSFQDTFNINRKWLESGEGAMFIVEKNTQQFSYKDDEAILIGQVPGPGEETNMVPLGNNKFGMTVPLIPVKAYAGYLDNFGDPEFYDTLEKHNVSVIGNFRGHYLAFVVKGNSMENWESEEMARKSIPEGSIVTCRDIQKQHWRNKLHLHRFQFYVIVHIDGIITKEIIEHNIDEGYIICHSLNPDKVKWPDRRIELNDCLQILNIVDKSIPI